MSLQLPFLSGGKAVDNNTRRLRHARDETVMLASRPEASAPPMRLSC